MLSLEYICALSCSTGVSGNMSDTIPSLFGFHLFILSPHLVKFFLSFFDEQNFCNHLLLRLNFTTNINIYNSLLIRGLISAWIQCGIHYEIYNTHNTEQLFFFSTATFFFTEVLFRHCLKRTFMAILGVVQFCFPYYVLK